MGRLSVIIGTSRQFSPSDPAALPGLPHGFLDQEQLAQIVGAEQADEDAIAHHRQRMAITILQAGQHAFQHLMRISVPNWRCINP
jgi:hypothetical protein